MHLHWRLKISLELSFPFPYSHDVPVYIHVSVNVFTRASFFLFFRYPLEALQSAGSGVRRDSSLTGPNGDLEYKISLVRYSESTGNRPPAKVGSNLEFILGWLNESLRWAIIL